ncbi:hypothetical protein B0T21DRAFT_366199 [Apiosordaria backusii]|uniref:Uncharacterized protein n=1 Tax=Apiosordaria backusii TaxID=314023 RepID=A0AA40EF33_9PEZI|nr:hypothetical protein B0T21DRAFT_366199 [Apiosordaria backusii]
MHKSINASPRCIFLGPFCIHRCFPASMIASVAQLLPNCSFCHPIPSTSRCLFDSCRKQVPSPFSSWGSTPLCPGAIACSCLQVMNSPCIIFYLFFPF